MIKQRTILNEGNFSCRIRTVLMVSFTLYSYGKEEHMVVESVYDLIFKLSMEA
jgi:hypothetical protein